MRRPVIAAAACATLFALCAGAAAAAPPQHLGDGHHVSRGVTATTDTGSLSGRETSFAPLGARLGSGSTTITGSVRNSDGIVVASASVEWWSQAGSVWYYNTATTDASGNYAMTALPTANGRVLATYPDGETVLGFLAQSWNDGETKNYAFYPGRVSASATLGGPWKNSFTYVGVRLWGSDRYSYGRVPADGSTTPSAVFDVNQGSYVRGSAKFFYNEGVEFAQSITVASGQTAAAGIAVSEADAQRIWSTAPYRASGKPGTTFRIVRNNFPAGWTSAVTGYTDNPSESASKSFGSKTSSGATKQSLAVKIPAGAKPGYAYWVGLQHTNGIGTLYLETPFQVCTMKPSKTGIRRGAKIRLTGVVPTQGHWGSTPGTPKTVAIWAHRGTAGVPTTWSPKSRGWVLVGTVKCNGMGVYKTPYFKPLKTLTLVAQYGGDDWYWGGYTSVKKITVR